MPIRENFKNDADRLLHLQRQDPITFWLRRAHESAVRLNLPVEFLGEAIGIIVGALTEQWIREKIVARRKGMLGVFHGHLIKALTVAGDNNLVTVTELAICLKQLSKIPGLYQVIQESLRADNKFDSALLQLAWAYRF